MLTKIKQPVCCVGVSHITYTLLYLGNTIWVGVTMIQTAIDIRHWHCPPRKYLSNPHCCKIIIFQSSLFINKIRVWWWWTQNQRKKIQYWMLCYILGGSGQDHLEILFNSSNNAMRVLCTLSFCYGFALFNTSFIYFFTIFVGVYTESTSV